MTDPSAGCLVRGHFRLCRTVRLQLLLSFMKMERISYYQRCGIIMALLPWPSVHSAGCLVSQFLGTRTNSRHISGSMLGRSELLVVERSARQSVHYWRNSMCKGIGSWKWRTYWHAQRQLLASALVPPPVILLSHRYQGLMRVHSLYARKQWIPDALKI
jgi:hypothetical protein